MKKVTSFLLTLVFAVGLFFSQGFLAYAASTVQSYDFSNMTYSTSWGTDYNISDSKINLTFNGKYSEIKLLLPETVDLSDCSSVTFNAASTEGNIAFKLYDVDGKEVAVRYDFNGNGDCTFTPDSTAKVNCIGIMSMVDDSISAVVNSVSFKMNSNTGASSSSYDFSKMTYNTSWGTDYNISDGKANLTFSGKYDEIKFSLPDNIDLSNCSSVTFNAVSTEGNIAFKLYDVDGKEVAVRYDFNGSGDCTFTPDSTAKANCIGIMSMDSASISAIINSVSFKINGGIVSPIDKEKNLLTTYGKVFGKLGAALTAPKVFNSNTLNYVKEEHNAVTPGNEMKPGSILSAEVISVNEAKDLGYYIPDDYTETTVPTLNLDTVDAMMKTCYDNGLVMRGHTLVWHQQTPDWYFRTGYSKDGSYVDKATMDARMEFYIKSVMNHVYDSEYGSIVYAWDVVNEYLHGLNSGSGWQQIYGSNTGTTPEFVKEAFEFAYETLEKYGLEEKVKLFYNDYNTYMEVNEVINLINFINSDKKICAGIGMQSHLATNYPSPDLYKSTLQSFVDAGFEVQITELDVTCSDFAVQSQYYYDLMSGILDVKKNGGNITALIFWGLSDEDSWRSDQNPLLYSDYSTQKDAYAKVIQAYFDAGYTLDDDNDDETVLGDVNNDGKVSVKDYVQLQRYLLDNSAEINIKNSDMNEDGKINVTDALLLKKKLME